MDVPANAHDKAQRVEWNTKHMTKFISSGALKCNQLKRISGELQEVIEAMKYVEAGKNRGEKLVYTF